MRLLIPIFLIGSLTAPVTLLAQGSYTTPLSKILRYDDGSKLTIQVDTANQRVEENFYDRSGALGWKLVRELDEDLQPMRAIKFDSQDQIVSRHKYICLRGRVEEEEILSPKNALLARMVYFYDKKGRVIRIDHFNAAGNLVSSSKSSGNPTEPIRRDVSSSTPTAPR